MAQSELQKQGVKPKFDLLVEHLEKAAELEREKRLSPYSREIGKIISEDMKKRSKPTSRAAGMAAAMRSRSLRERLSSFVLKNDRLPAEEELVKILK